MTFHVFRFLIAIPLCSSTSLPPDPSLAFYYPPLSPASARYSRFFLFPCWFQCSIFFGILYSGILWKCSCHISYLVIISLIMTCCIPIVCLKVSFRILSLLYFPDVILLVFSFIGHTSKPYVIIIFIIELYIYFCFLL